MISLEEVVQLTIRLLQRAEAADREVERLKAELQAATANGADREAAAKEENDGTLR